MAAGWMFHAAVISLLAAVAARSLEPVFQARRVPTRWLWAGVLAFGFTWPLVRATGFDWPRAVVNAGAGSGDRILPMEPLSVTMPDRAIKGLLNVFVLGAWAAGTLALSCAIIRAGLRLRKMSDGWERAEVKATPVLLAPNIGPGVVGLTRGRIVLPRWLVEGPDEIVELVLAHEGEHLRAGDHLLLSAGLLVAILFPWNPGLWWAVRRLRQAVEMDCDVRVLRKRPRAVRTYAKTLLNVSRRSLALPVAPLSFMKPESALERRIRAMTTEPAKSWSPSAVLLVGAAVLFGSAACLTPDVKVGTGEEASPIDPVEDATEVQETEALADRPRRTVFTTNPVITNSGDVVSALEKEYPALLRRKGVGGTVVVWFFIDETGDLQKVRIRDSSGRDALDRAALRVAEQFEFAAARNEGEPVPVWISLPITFTPGTAAVGS